jgi:hypothetical protein
MEYQLWFNILQIPLREQVIFKIMTKHFMFHFGQRLPMDLQMSQRRGRVVLGKRFPPTLPAGRQAAGRFVTFIAKK